MTSKFKSLLFASFTAVLLVACHPGKKQDYVTVEGDPLKARIYTLDNGLKIYMSVYKNAPRIQTYIAVKAGSKNDPADATGLAHYLEHLLFKGTDKFGSKNFAQEAPQLQKIEDLFEAYRKLTDPAARKAMYHQIDSISGVASGFAIANEYDKLMSAIGSTGTNAYTSLEQTIYIENIPSNQLDKWATIQAERFRNPILRLFHTELEAVYEEKNRGLDDDNQKMWEAIFAGLFQKHTYGTQTTIGTIDHLKNPSIKKIKEYYNTYYVPNNMALCLSGDFDPDSAIRIIRAKFAPLVAKPVPAFVPAKEEPITKPIVKEVFGPNAEEIAVGFRFEGVNSSESDYMNLIAKILANGKAGLMDLNLNQQQKVLECTAIPNAMKDYSFLVLDGRPKQGQTLDQVKGLMLEQLDKIKKGEFPDWLLSAIINNLKLEEIKAYEDNKGRANAFVTSFTSDIAWDNYVKNIDKLSHISRQQVIDFAKDHFKDNYVVVYKRTGEDKMVKKVEKPIITPVQVNRDQQSDFVKHIIEQPSPAIEPVFVDYDKDIQKLHAVDGKVPVLYHENKENKTFSLYYLVNRGTNQDKKLKLAINYLNYLGTSKYSPEQLQQEFYKLGCSFGVESTENQTWLLLNGLSEHFESSLTLFESLLKDPIANPKALENLISDELKNRQDEMLDKRTILFSALLNFGMYGEHSPFRNILTATELQQLKPEALIDIIKSFTSYKHDILYYGSHQPQEVVAALNKYHGLPVELKNVPEDNEFTFNPNNHNVYVVDYDMKQAEILLLSKSSLYDKAIVPKASIFNEYFGGGMASVVFQEMRESKALAYSVFSRYNLGKRKDKHNFILSYIGTQSDKLPEALSGLTSLMNDMPLSQNVFDMSKTALLQKIRTERITRTDILFNYENNLKLGVNYDLRKDIFTQLPGMTMEDVKQFQATYMKDQPYVMLVLGKKENLNLPVLQKYGKVNFLQLKDVFGYEKQ